MGMVGVAEWVFGVVAECVNVEGTTREDLDLWRVFVEVEGHRNGANSAMSIVCLSGCDLISMWVVDCVCGLTMDAPNVGFSIFWDPSVYMKLSGSTLRGMG